MAEMMQALAEYRAPDLLRPIASKGHDSSSRHEIYAAMMAFAADCLKRDMTQTAADTLAFLLQDVGVNASVRGEAAEVFAELESRICPRVILDAQTFAAGMDLLTMLEYLLDTIDQETT